MKHFGLLGVAASAFLPGAALGQDVSQTSPESPADLAQDADIVVTGQRAVLARSLEAKRAAIGVLDVAAADEIGRLPDRNVAEVIERLPGVGVTYDQGEGRYVSIRGVPSNLNNYTLSGLEIGNPDGATRALPLDIVSGQLLNRVEVAKVKTADMDGQGIGGTVNLVPQTAFDFREAFALSASGKAGYQELNKKVPYQADGSIAGRFGADEQFGAVLGLSYSFRDFNSEGFYPDNWRPDARFARGGVPDNIKYTEYSLARTRIGATGSLDWHPSDTQTLYVRGFYSKFIEDEVRPRYRLDFATAALAGSPAFTVNPDGLTGRITGTGAERREDLRLDYKAKWLVTGIAGGSTEIDQLKLAYEGGYSRNQTLDKYPLWQFRCNPGTVDFDFGQKIYDAAPATECTADQLQFRQFQDFRQLNDETIWQAKLDGTYDLGGDSFVKFGGKYRNTDRTFDQDQPTWVRATATASRWTLGQYGLGGPTECVYPDSDNTDRCFANGPTFDIPALQDFTDANLGGALIPLDAATTLANNTVADFALKEDVVAGYLMANLRFGAITVTPGLRYEHTRLDVIGFRLQNGSAVVRARGGGNYDDWLPSIIVRIAPSDDSIFRLAYSQSLGRPEYSTLSPGGSYNTADGTASFGNPDLEQYRADNFDATAEWYFAPGGLLSVGGFAKFIKNPIFTQTSVLTNQIINGVTIPALRVAQPFNADRGDIVGIEAQYQQQLTFLPGLLSGLGVQLTGTLTDSTLRLPNGRTSTFPSQSQYLYGAELFYQRGRVEASVAYHNTGAALLVIGDPAYNDQFNDDLRRLDAKASVALFENVRLFAEAQNLTDEPARQYQAGNRDWLIQNERYGRTFYGGVSVHF
jgi:TonB-dependent receptor